MSDDPSAQFVAGLPAATRPIAERLVSIITGYASFDAAIKWRQLTFAVDGDFDHWICAVAATKHQVHLVFHFGSLLREPGAGFEPSGSSKFVRKLGYNSVDDVDDAVVRDLLTQALEALPRFKATWKGR
ncbi:DUF1801 domain-containing protein [Mycolicibacterium sp. XJ870]